MVLRLRPRWKEGGSEEAVATSQVSQEPASQVSQEPGLELWRR